ncbi:unnamed protein product [Camellia sinensis]
MDTWEELDLDELSYEELFAVGKLVRIESKGLSSDTIASLPSVNYKTQSTQDGNNDLPSDGEACAHLLNVLAPEHGSATTLDTKDPTERANLIIEHVERMDYKRYVTPKDIVEGSANLNLAFVAQIFQQRNGLSMDTKNMSFAEMMIDDAQTSREERWF